MSPQCHTFNAANTRRTIIRSIDDIVTHTVAPLLITERKRGIIPLQPSVASNNSS
jgi:hypothetical protein